MNQTVVSTSSRCSISADGKSNLISGRGRLPRNQRAHTSSSVYADSSMSCQTTMILSLSRFSTSPVLYDVEPSVRGQRKGGSQRCAPHLLPKRSSLKRHHTVLRYTPINPFIRVQIRSQGASSHHPDGSSTTKMIPSWKSTNGQNTE